MTAVGLNAIFAALAISNRSLKYLDFSGNFVTVESLHALRLMLVKNGNLKYLVASDLHKFNQEAREQIQKGLSINTSLKSFNLSQCSQEVFNEFERNVPGRIKILAESVIVGRQTYRKKTSYSVDKRSSFDEN